MEASNTAERGSAFEGSLRAEHRSGDRSLRELDWKSLPCVELPRPSFRSGERRGKQKLPAAKEVFEVQAASWRLLSVEKLPAFLRPDPAFRRFHPIASGLLMRWRLWKARIFRSDIFLPHRLSKRQRLEDFLQKPRAKRPPVCGRAPRENPSRFSRLKRSVRDQSRPTAFLKFLATSAETMLVRARYFTDGDCRVF